MANMIAAKDIFKRGEFKSYSEFYLALAIGSILHNKGYSLNMDGMRVDAEAIPKDMIKYYKRLLNDGAISLSMFERGVTDLDLANTDIDTTYFDELPLAKNNGEKLDWTLEYAKENYGEHGKKFLEFIKLGNTLVHLVASHLVNVILNGEKRKLVLHFDSQKAKSTFIYVNIYSCLQTLQWIRDYVELDIDFGDYRVDLDYSIFCNNGKVAGHNRLYSISEKLSLLDRYGMVEGAILVLWSRDGMCENNPFGHITGASVVRLDEIGDNFLGVTKMNLNKTKEEVLQDYYDIDENIRSLFVDMVGKKPHQSSTELDIYGIGVHNHFADEEHYLTLIDGSEEVYKTVTIDGKVGTVKMSEVDAVYWLLRQYEIEFDMDLFKEMYFGSKEPLWDMYN